MKETDKQLDVRLELVEKMTTLVAAGLGFVVGLAWNDAIQGLFAVLFPDPSSLVVKFIYAIIVTIGIVLLTTWLSRTSSAIKEKIKR